VAARKERVTAPLSDQAIIQAFKGKAKDEFAVVKADARLAMLFHNGILDLSLCCHAILCT